jgi:hypothetical protein
MIQSDRPGVIDRVETLLAESEAGIIGDPIGILIKGEWFVDNVIPDEYQVQTGLDEIAVL